MFLVIIMQFAYLNDHYLKMATEGYFDPYSRHYWFEETGWVCESIVNYAVMIHHADYQAFLDAQPNGFYPEVCESETPVAPTPREPEVPKPLVLESPLVSAFKVAVRSRKTSVPKVPETLSPENPTRDSEAIRALSLQQLYKIFEGFNGLLKAMMISQDLKDLVMNMNNDLSQGKEVSLKPYVFLNAQKFEALSEELVSQGVMDLTISKSGQARLLAWLFFKDDVLNESETHKLPSLKDHLAGLKTDEKKCKKYLLSVPHSGCANTLASIRPFGECFKLTHMSIRFGVGSGSYYIYFNKVQAKTVTIQKEVIICDDAVLLPSLSSVYTL